MTLQHLPSAEHENVITRVMAITRSAALAEMASGIAHELNQPLGAIATYAQAGVRMLDRPEPMLRQALDVFRQINQEALNAGEGIRRIRRLFDPHDAEPVVTSMSDVIAGVWPVLDLLSRQYGGQLDCDSDDGAPVKVDRAKIQHVIFALVQNGFEAARESPSHPRVFISVKSDRYTVETSVLDSGPGIPAHVEKQIFRPFFTTKRCGTGLGLASTHAILEAHDGAVGFENPPDGGCRFWFRMPVASQSANR